MTTGRHASCVEVSGPPLQRLLTPLPRCQPDRWRSGRGPGRTKSKPRDEGSNMSNWGVRTVESEPPPVRRVRQEVKDGVAVVAASAVASTFLAIAVTVLMKLVG